MEIRDGSVIEGLIDSIGVEEQEELERDRETAARFPESVEEYMTMPEVERLQMAAKMVSTYFPYFTYEAFNERAQYPTEEKSVPVKIATDQPGIIINGAVAYDRGQFDPGWHSRPASLFVWAQAEDATSGISSGFTQLGRIEIASSLRGRINSNETFDLDDPRAKELIEIIDAAAANLLNGVISENRKQIGTKALQGLAQR